MTATLERFLAERTVEMEAEGSTEGGSLGGEMTILLARVIALKVAVVKNAPLPGWVKRALLLRIARKNWPNHPESPA